MKFKKIIIRSKAEQKKVMAKLEEEGYLLANGAKPTDFKRLIGNYPFALHIKNKAITWNYNIDAEVGYTVLNAKAYLNKTETIVIYRNGSETIALDKSTGKRAVAKCHPEDEFDFELGAKLAFVRLFEEKKEEPKETPISVGDIVRVVSIGSVYSNYVNWSGLGKYTQNFVEGSLLDDTKKYKVLNVGKHDNRKDTLALIQNIGTTQVFIIGIDGIRKE